MPRRRKKPDDDEVEAIHGVIDRVDSLFTRFASGFDRLAGGIDWLAARRPVPRPPQAPPEPPRGPRQAPPPPPRTPPPPPKTSSYQEALVAFGWKDHAFTKKDVSKRHRQLVALFHPDDKQGQGDDAMLKRINAAAAILKARAS